MLVVEHLRKEFKNVIAVDDLSFIVHPGRIFGLLGPNGAGKTTTIRTILNIIKPTTGSIRLRQTEIGNEIFNIIGYLPEERGLYKKSRVADVITYMCRLKNISAAETSARTNMWLKKMEIENYKERKIQELSKGNQQKVQFIIAVIHDPEILVLDEPFAGFDPLNQQLILDNIMKFSSEGKIIILSTHQMETAEKLCHEILLMNKGKEVLKGDLPSIKRKFGGNYVKIGFRGDSDFLKQSKSIDHMSCFNGNAEIKLFDHVNPPDFLKEISLKTEVIHFSIVEPTLNKIFIDSVKEG